MASALSRHSSLEEEHGALVHGQQMDSVLLTPEGEAQSTTELFDSWRHAAARSAQQDQEGAC